jgi:kynurenine formamidase
MKRRAFLSLASAGLGSACMPPSAPAPRHLVDLTHTLSPRFPFIPVQGLTFPFEIHPIATLASHGVYANAWRLTEHVGTHVDAPSHFAEGGTSLDAIPLADLVAPLAVLDFRARAARDPDAALGVDEILAWEREHARLPERAAVLLHTGWDARAADPPAFVNLDAAGVMHFPGFSEHAIAWLCRERVIVGIGTDALSFDPGTDTGYHGHKTLFRAGKWAVECVANLARVPPIGATLVVGAPKVEGASGGPSRLFAMW